MSFDFPQSIKRFLEILTHGRLYFAFDDPGTLVYFGKIKKRMADDPNFKAHVDNCVNRFFNKDWPSSSRRENRFEDARKGEFVSAVYDHEYFDSIYISKLPGRRWTIVSILGDETVDFSHEGMERKHMEIKNKK